MTPTEIWYTSLIKPFWAPPSWLFAPVWTILYLIIVISFGKVLYDAIQQKIPRALAIPFVLNLFFNIAFSPIQFKLQNNWLAALDISLVLITLLWALQVIWKYKRWVALVNLPYLLWVFFATALQFTITVLNA